MTNVKLIFDNPTKEQLQHIYNAETELIKADITFGSSCDTDGGKIISRVWELDWSLKGARIVVIKP